MKPSEIETWVKDLVITQGEGEGRKISILPWESDFIAGAFAPGIKTAGLSVARGNGKTTLLAAIAAASVVGSLAMPRADCVVVAASFQQARILFEHTLAFLHPWRRQLKILDNTSFAQVTDTLTGARLRAIASDPGRAHGLAPFLVIADEPAQWQDTQSARMYAALQTSLGKIAGARFVAIGTMPDDSTHWFQSLCTLPSSDDHFSRWYGVRDKECDICDEKLWTESNPSLEHMPNLRAQLVSESTRALSNPGLEFQFRALRLNSGTPDVESRDLLVQLETWKSCLTDNAPALGNYVLGLDLGGAAALSAAACYWPANHSLHIRAAIGDTPDLLIRGKADGVSDLYAVAAQRGLLTPTPGRVADVGTLLDQVFSEFGAPAAVVCDTYRQGELCDLLEKRGYRWPVVTRSGGFKDGSEDVRLFREAVLSRRIRTVPNYLLEAALAVACVVYDSTANARLAKRTESGRRLRTRDDLAAAAILAVAHGQRVAVRPVAYSGCV